MILISQNATAAPHNSSDTTPSTPGVLPSVRLFMPLYTSSINVCTMSISLLEREGLDIGPDVLHQTEFYNNVPSTQRQPVPRRRPPVPLHF